MTSKTQELAKAEPDSVPKERALTTKQRAFVDEYLINGYNGTQAALTAGYSPNGADVQAFNLLRNTRIHALIEAHLADAGITRVRVLQEMADIAFRTDLADYESLLGDDLRKLRESGVNTRHIKKFKTSSRVLVTGDDDAVSFGDVSIELKDSAGMLKELAKILGLHDTSRSAGVNVNSGGGPVQVNIPQGTHPIDELHALSQAGLSSVEPSNLETMEIIMPSGMEAKEGEQ